MSTKTRNLTNIEGAAVTAPTSTGFTSNGVETFPTDAAFVLAHAAVAGSIYWNTTEKCLREYNGTVWQYDKTTLLTETDATSTGADQAITPGVAQVIRFTSNTLASINNINPALQKYLYLANDQSSQALTIKNNAGGTAANRILTGNGQDFVLKTNQIIGLVYDNESTRWRLRSKSLTSSLEAFADDAAYVTAHAGVGAGDEYWNTTTQVVRSYDGTDWQNNKVLFSTENNATPTGANADLTPAKHQIIKVSNASLTSIRGIIPAIQEFLILVNGTGATITIRNQEATATAANRIITGTGVDLSLANDASLLMSYDSYASRWRVVGGSGSSSSDPTNINYFTDPGFENTANGATPSQVTLYNDGASAVPIDGTGGVVTGVTFLATTTGPIRGTTSGELSKDAANRQGTGIAFAFIIPAVDKGVTSSVNWDMLTSLNYVAGDIVFYIYDVTNSTLITPRSVSLPKLDSYGKFFSDFGLTSGTSYRLLLHIATTSALAYTVKFDTMVNSTTRNTQAGPFVGPYEEVSTFAITGSTSNPTPGAGATYYRNTFRDVDCAEIRYEYLQTASGSAGSGTYRLPVPSGLTVDTTRLGKLGTNSNNNYCGDGTLLASTTELNVAVYYNPAALAFEFELSNDTTAPASWGNTLGSMAANPLRFAVSIRVPISQWSGSGANFGPGANVQVFSSSAGTWDSAAAAGNTVGGLSPITGSLTATRTKVVRLPFAPQSISDIKVVFLPTGFSVPIPSELWGGYVGMASADFGVKVTGLSGTDVTVTFHQYHFQGTTYNSLTGAVNWAAGDGAWGLIVTNPSAPVGIDPARNGLPGIINYYNEDDTTLAACTFQGNLGGSASAGVAIKITRNGRVVTLEIPLMQNIVPTTNSIALFSNTLLPSWARPTASKATPCFIYNNGAYVATSAGELFINTSGRIEFYRDIIGTAFTNSANAGWFFTQISYTV